jgi:hypothetical protein
MCVESPDSNNTNIFESEYDGSYQALGRQQNSCDVTVSRGVGDSSECHTMATLSSDSLAMTDGRNGCWESRCAAIVDIFRPIPPGKVVMRKKDAQILFVM